MGEVYRAEQLEPVRRPVALKLMRGHRLDARQLAYFEVERQVLAQMQHPAIAQIFDAGMTPDGVPYFAMELIEGRPIVRYCDEAALGVRQRIELFIRVCEGVQHAHQKGVIHRDLKPANILVSELDGRPQPKIIDFGIATATSRFISASGAEESAGTPAYMSPEQRSADARELDIRSDVYSLGIVLYELLTGIRPEATAPESGTARTTMRPPSHALETGSAVSSATLPLAGAAGRVRLRELLRRDLDWIVMKAIRFEREQRYSGADALADDLRRFLGDRPVLATPGGRGYVARKFVRRHRAGLTAAGIALVALLAGLMLSLYGLWQADAQRSVAQKRSAELEQVVAFQQSMLKGIDIEAMGAGVIARQRGQIEALTPDPSGAIVDIAGWDALMGRTSPADLARGIIDDHVLKGALEAVEIEFAQQPLLAADLRESVAEVYFAIGDYPRSAELMAQVATTRAGMLGENDARTLRAQREAAGALNRAGRLQEARDLQEQLRERIKRNPGLPDELRNGLELDLSLTLLGQGETARAIELQQQLLDRVTASKGATDPEALKIRNNYAISLMRAGRREEGRDHFESLVVLRTEAFGQEHPDTLSSMLNLAAARAQAGDLEGALELQRKTYAIQKRKLGDDHPLTLSDRSNLGITLMSLGQLEESRLHLEYAVEARERVLGADHPQTLRSMLNLAAAYSRSEQFERALEMIRVVLLRRRAKLGVDHPDTLTAAANFATSLRDAGQATQALAEAEEVLARRQRVLGEKHPDTTESRMVVASVASDVVRPDRAREVLEPVLQQPDAHPRSRMRVAARLYRLYLQAGESARAESVLQHELAAELARDPAGLDPGARALREELEREMQGTDVK